MAGLTERRSTAALRLVEPGESASALASPTPTRGEISLGFSVRAGRTRMTRSYQAGCLRVRAPRLQSPDAEAVLINTGGGVVGGDRLVQDVRWEAGARALVASQAAEKVYRSIGPQAEIATRLTIEAGAYAEWLPQETILFDRARLRRSVDIELADGAHFLGLEAVIFGRAAMGERVRQAFLRDSWRVRRGGRLVYADVQKLEGAVDLLMDRPAIGAGARAMAVVLLVADDAADRLADVREVLGGSLGRGAASAWNGLLAVRLLASGGHVLRRDLMPVLAALRGGRAPPRVWTC